MCASRRWRRLEMGTKAAVLLAGLAPRLAAGAQLEVDAAREVVAQTAQRATASKASVRIAEARELYGEAPVSVLQVAPPIAAQVLILSPAPTLRQVQHRGTTGGLPLLPYSMMIANSYGQIVFGVLLGDMSIVLTNTSGLIFGGIFCAVWWYWAARKTDGHRPAGIAAAAIVFVTAAAVTLPRAQSLTVIGLFSSALVVGLFSGPLAVIRQVIRDKNTSTVPLPFAVASTVNCALWTTYGALVLREVFVWAPNLLGLFAALGQLSLFGLYGCTPKTARSPVSSPAEVHCSGESRAVPLLRSGSATPPGASAPADQPQPL